MVVDGYVVVMSLNENDSNQASENMEYENKVTIEEVPLLGCVKKELEEFEFADNQYKVISAYENIFGETSKDQRDNIATSIDFIDDIMKTEPGTVKLEDVKEENTIVIRKNFDQPHCNSCGGNYEGYCPNCSSLSHILNNVTPNIQPEPDLNTTPINILEIREVSGRQSVFALKTLQKGIILGPFEGIAPIESTTGLQWKIKDKKFVNDQNGNWMKYIDSVANHASKNLDVFQLDRILYFETSREIQEGEELLVCYGVEEQMLKSGKDEEFYLVPVKKEECPKVFACTLWCLGFCLEKCLVEHKSMCPQWDHGVNIEDFEIIQCDCCKVWLEKQEYVESHMIHCLENYNRLSRNLRGYEPINTGEEDKVRVFVEILPSINVDASYSTPSTEIIDPKRSCGIGCEADKKDHFRGDQIKNIHSSTSEKEYKCSECYFQTNRKYNLKLHVNTHKDIKPFECDICKKGFVRKDFLKLHIKNEHSNTSEKEYKCSKCSYQTNYKSRLKSHLNTHSNIKPFECDICKQKFGHRNSLNEHIRIQHSNTNEKEYKCSECSFQTNHKNSLKSHLNTHKNIKQFECDMCKKRFTLKRSLRHHIKDHHSHTSEKEYKCSECSYQTNRKHDLKNHRDTHFDIKAFECEICKKRFTQKGSLNYHIKNQHLNTIGTEYKCSECSYQTNGKEYLELHLSTHKSFECDICKKRFTQKSSLNKHIRNQHSNTNEKAYKCSECSYKTKRKELLTLHLNTHNDIKAFECDICKKGFSQKSTLNRHIKNQHSNTSE